MSFHPQKCTVIRIATNQRHVIPTQYTLEVVDSAKYLGVSCNNVAPVTNLCRFVFVFR